MLAATGGGVRGPLGACCGGANDGARAAAWAAASARSLSRSMNPEASSYGGGNASCLLSVGSETNGLSGILTLRLGGTAGVACDGVERWVPRAIALSDVRPSGVRLGLFVESSM